MTYNGVRWRRENPDPQTTRSEVEVMTDYTSIPSERIHGAHELRRCGDGWHVSRGNVSRSCYCGELSNPAYRAPWRRIADKIRMYMITHRNKEN